MRVTRILVGAGALALVLARTAAAENYETFIDIDSEEELQDLLSQEEISQETFDTLLPMLQTGVDLNEATREELYALPNLTLIEVDKILKYREDAGWISDPAVLVTNGILSERKLLAIAGFLVVRDRNLPPLAITGMVRLQSRWSSKDNRPPPTALQARAQTLGHLRLGFTGVMTEDRVGPVRYDPNRDALVAEAPSTQLHPAKFYAYWNSESIEAVAGTYRIGFGQRLTFDDTNRIVPNGIQTDDEIIRGTDLTRKCNESKGELAVTPCDTNIYVTPDFHWSERMLGAAAGLKEIPAGPGVLQAYAFLSLQPRSIYQYELYDRSKCDDPRNDSDPNCSAPQVYRQQDDPLAPTSRFSYQTLPDMYRETVIGGNLTFFTGSRVHVGLTGYGAREKFLTQGIDLDFQEWSRTPYGGNFGAIGADFQVGMAQWLDLYGETAVSFDHQDPNRGAGSAGILRAVATWDKNEVEASLRSYGTDFVNPYSRAISAADEYDGLRVRDEVGGRVRYTGHPGEHLNTRATADLWTTPSDDHVKTLLYFRNDFEIDRLTRVGFWTRYEDKGLGQGGRTQCYEVTTMTDENGEPIACSGMKWTGAATARVEPTRTLIASGQADVAMLDDARYDSKFRYDTSVWATLMYKPDPHWRIRSRGRWLFQDVADNHYLEQSLWGYLDFTYIMPRQYRARLRYDLYYRLDKRASTLDRQPNPEHWLWLELEAKF